MSTKVVIELNRHPDEESCDQNLTEVMNALNSLTGYSAERAWVEAAITYLTGDEDYVPADFELFGRWRESYRLLVAAVDAWAEKLPRRKEPWPRKEPVPPEAP